jgi:hypothetical protein
MLCHAPAAQEMTFKPCPVPLTLAIWDLGECAQKVLGSCNPISFAHMHKREQILIDVLSFRPRDGSQAIKGESSQSPKG